MAIKLYFKLYGTRCIICSKAVLEEEAVIAIEDGIEYLFHEKCLEEQK